MYIITLLNIIFVLIHENRPIKIQYMNFELGLALGLECLKLLLTIFQFYDGGQFIGGGQLYDGGQFIGG